MSFSLLRYFTLGLLLALGATTASTDVDWWESATLYHIYPRSFMDSDGDGVGDLNGITSRLEFLKELGVTATWLSPIFESPMADMGYDVANFTKIDPLFGTMEDFDAMLAKGHKLGLKIILDFVPNHSSDECEWFQKSIRREDGYDDFYIWQDGKIDPETGNRTEPNNWSSVFQGSAWTWVEERQQYYLHQFLAKQPDFNYRNPKVRQTMLDVMKFWLDRGVDAFRIDAAPYFVEKMFDNGTFPDEPVFDPSISPDPSDFRLYTMNQPENAELLYEWRSFLDEYQSVHGGDTRAQIIEAYTSIEYLSEYITNGTHIGGQLPMNFNFVHLQSSSTAKDIEEAANNWMDVMWTRHKVANWDASNHDNSRLATRMGSQRVDTMTMIMHSLPGTSITYYGEEIGMPDGQSECTPQSTTCDFREPERTPMQWDTSKNAGFSTANSTWLPVNEDYKSLNVQIQRGVARSSLQITKGMIALKKTAAFKAFKEDGGFSYAALSEQVFQVVRTAVGREEYRVLANLGNQIESFEGLTNKTMEYVLLNSYSPHNYGDKVDLSKRIILMPYEGIVLRWSA
ncbi:maltase A2-like [Ceratitis capitata]|uniref:alpha-glucosidase n=1 Tax=Ceratitis capitata TaxID=7213 RepID=A0A811VBC8_CERCA|nr:maltase A2-like [Ceratitis capitata]CAD7012686.1 unnamed protein product [Ceratitis capitata]